MDDGYGQPPVEYWNEALDFFPFPDSGGEDAFFSYGVGISAIDDRPDITPRDFVRSSSSERRYEGTMPSPSPGKCNPQISPASGDNWQVGRPGDSSHLSDFMSSLMPANPQSPNPFWGSVLSMVNHSDRREEEASCESAPHEISQPGHDFNLAALPGMRAMPSWPMTQPYRDGMGVGDAGMGVCDQDILCAYKNTLAAMTDVGSRLWLPGGRREAERGHGGGGGVGGVHSSSNGDHSIIPRRLGHAVAVAAMTDANSRLGSREGQQEAGEGGGDWGVAVRSSFNDDRSVPKSLGEQMRDIIAKRALVQASGPRSVSSAEEIGSIGSSNAMSVTDRFSGGSDEAVARRAGQLEPRRKRGKRFSAGREASIGSSSDQFGRSAKEEHGETVHCLSLARTARRKSATKRTAKTGLEGGPKPKRNRMVRSTTTERDGCPLHVPSSPSEVLPSPFFDDAEVTLKAAEELSSTQQAVGPRCSDSLESLPVPGPGQSDSGCKCTDRRQLPVADTCWPETDQVSADGSDQVEACNNMEVEEGLFAVQRQAGATQNSQSLPEAGQGSTVAAAVSESLVLPESGIDPFGGTGPEDRHCGRLGIICEGATELPGRATDADVNAAEPAPKHAYGIGQHLSNSAAKDQSGSCVSQTMWQDAVSHLNLPPPTPSLLDDSPKCCPDEVEGLKRPWAARADSEFPVRLMAASSRILANCRSSGSAAARKMSEGSSSSQEEVDEGEGVGHSSATAAFSKSQKPPTHPAETIMQNLSDWLQATRISTDGDLSKPPGLLTDVLPLLRFQLGQSIFL